MKTINQLIKNVILVLIICLNFNFSNAQSYLIGPASPAIGTSANYTSHNHQDVFNVLNSSGVYIDSITIYPSTASTSYTIYVKNSSGTTIASSTGTSTVSGNQSERIKVNMFVPMGTGYKLGLTTGSVGMLRNSTGVSYPYTVPSVMTFTGSTYQSSYWYFFYNIRISLPSLATDAGLTSMIFPTDTICSGTNAATVRLKNFGPNSLSSVAVNWKVNNVSQTAYNWSGTMAVGDSANINIGTYNFLTGTNYNIDAYTSNPNGIADVVNTNDTIIKTGIYVNASPLANVIPSGAINICQNDSLLLTANTDSGLTYQWFKDGIAISGETDTSLTVKQAGSYMVNVTNSGCSTISNTAIVTLLQSPSANANALGPTTFCYGDSVFITANIGSGLTYQWKKDGIVIPGATSTTIYAKQSGAYTVTTTNLNFCSTISNTVVVSVSSLPIATATAQGVTTICYGDSVLIIANIDAGLTYQWKKDGVNIPGATDTLIYAKQDGAYTVTTTNINSCSNTSTPIIVTVNPLPVIDLGPDSTICETHQITLDAGAGMDSYLWSTGDTTQTIIVDSTGIGIGNKDFSVIVTQQGCVNADTIKIIVMDCSGISENIESLGINIYPNPSQGKINIDIPDGLDGLEITVFNSIGQKILSELITSKSKITKTIDLSEVPKGIYFIGLKSDGEQQFRKVILN